MTVDLEAAATMKGSAAVDNKLGSGRMFDGVAPRYDLLNRLMSLGSDGRWRRRAAHALALAPGSRVLDLATGTGDLAFALLDAHSDCQVTAVDPSEGMLAIAEQKSAKRGDGERLTLVTGDAQQLDFQDHSFDALTMAFGIRNVPDRARALGEIVRVVKPGGRIAILELSEPRGSLLASPARFWKRRVVPRLGALLSGAEEYSYLERSIAEFPAPEEFSRLMEMSGLDVLAVTPMSFGAVHLFLARPRGRA